MIVLKVLANSGQGNQFFMFSTAYALSKKFNQKLIIFSDNNIDFEKKRKFIIDRLNINDKGIKILCTNKIKNKVLNSLLKKVLNFYFMYIKRCKIYYDLADGQDKGQFIDFINKKNTMLCGYFECHKYFDDYREQLKEILNFNLNFSDEEKELLEEINNEKNSVSLHIRAGDFKNIGRCIPMEYYQSAIDYYEKKYKKVHFYVACTEPKILEKLRMKNYSLIVSKGQDVDLKDWYTLSQCKNHIISNSTYSWWAAYLSESNEVIIPSKKDFYNSFGIKDNGSFENFYPDSWNCIDEVFKEGK